MLWLQYDLLLRSDVTPWSVVATLTMRRMDLAGKWFEGWIKKTTHYAVQTVTDLYCELEL